MRRCSGCGGGVAEEFRFCPHCGHAQRAKIVEYFRGRRDLDDGDLRASIYLDSPRHVRLSIWRGECAESAISLDEDESQRLAGFLASVAPAEGRLRRRARELVSARSRR